MNEIQFHRWLAAWLVILGCAWLMQTAALLAQEPQQPQRPSFRRVWQNTPSAFPENGQETWTRLNRREFEATVQAVERKLAALDRPPWLTVTRYQATLEGEALLGTATWDVFNPHPHASLLSLPNFNLPLSSLPTWKDQPALLGSYQNQPLLLLVEKEGPQTLEMSWSLEGESRPDGTWYRLRLPAAAQAVVEITLPEAMRLEWPASPDSVRNLGTDAEHPQRQRWQVSFGGLHRPDLTLVVRPEKNKLPNAQPELRMRSEYQVDLSGVQARFFLDGDGMAVRSEPVRCAVDPELQIEEVLLPMSGGRTLPWQWEAAEQPRVLVISLPTEMARNATIEVRGRVTSSARLATDAPATTHDWEFRCPAITPLTQAVQRETLRIRIASPLQFVQWRFGAFQPTEPPRLERGFGEAFETWVLESPEDRQSPRPKAKITPGKPKTAIRWESAWQVGPGASSFVVRSVWQVQEGHLHTLHALLPEGWSVEDVALTPQETLAGWSWSATSPKQPLQVELREPLTAGNSVTLILRLKGPPPTLQPGKPTVVPIPHLVPLGEVTVEGMLAIAVQRGRGKEAPVPLYGASVQSMACKEVLPARHDDWFGLSQGMVPDFTFQTHQRQPAGELVLTPLPGMPEAHINIEVISKGHRQTINYEVQISPTMGMVSGVALRSTALLPPLSWRAETQQRTFTWEQQERKGAFRFTPSLSEPLKLRATVDLLNGAEIPLLLPECEVWTGQLRLHRPALDGPTLTGHGIVKIPVPPLPTALALGDMYRYDRTAQGVRLHEANQGVQEDKTRIQTSTLHLDLARDGKASCSYETHFMSIGNVPLRLRLPHDAVLAVVEIDGHPTSAVAWKEGILTFPAGSIAKHVRLEFEVFQPAHWHWWGSQWQFIVPQWQEPLINLDVRCTWHLDVSLLPLGIRTERVDVARQSWQTTARPGESISVIWLTSNTLRLLVLGLGAAFFLWFRWRWGHGWFLLALSGAAFTVALLVPFAAAAFLAVGIGFGAGLGILCRRWSMQPHAGRALPPMPRALVGCLFLTLCVVYCPMIGQAQTTSPDLVYILPGPAHAPQDQIALVPSSLWKELQRLARKPCADLPPYLLQHARIKGEEKSGIVRWEAEVKLHVFADTPVEIPVVVGTSRLRTLTLDGAPALATPLLRGEGVRLRVDSSGSHTMRVAWDTPVDVQGALRTQRCQVPRCAVGQVEVTVPLPGRGLSVEGASGNRLHNTTERTRNLQVDAGDVRTLGLRWYTDQEEQSALQVTEAYHWDIRTKGVTQQGWLHYHVQRGTVEEVRLVLPAHGQLRHVEVLSRPGQAPLRLRQWDLVPVEGVGRVLVLRLSDLTHGHFLVHWELNHAVPPLRMPLLGWPSDSAVLPLSVGQPLNVERSAPWISFAVEGYQAELTGSNAQQLVVADAEEWKRLLPPEAVAAGLPQRIYRWPLGPGMHDVALKLLRQTAQAEITQQLSLALGMGEVRVLVTADIKQNRQPMSLMRWQIPTDLTITSLSSPALSSWSREGDELLVWLRPEVANPILTLTGWMATTRRDGHHAFEMPRLAFLNAKHLQGRLVLTAADRLDVQWVDRPANLSVVNNALSINSALGTYEHPGTPPKGTLRLTPRPELRDAMVSMMLSPSGDELQWEARIQAMGNRASRRLRLIFDAQTGPRVRVPPRAGVTMHVQILGDGRWQWTFVSLEPIIPLTLAGRVPFTPGKRASIPRITSPDVHTMTHRIKLGPDLIWAVPEPKPVADSEGWQVFPEGATREVQRQN